MGITGSLQEKSQNLHLNLQDSKMSIPDTTQDFVLSEIWQRVRDELVRHLSFDHDVPKGVASIAEIKSFFKIEESKIPSQEATALNYSQLTLNFFPALPNGLPNLKTLIISHNCIKTLTNIQFPHLQFLYANNNAIHFIEKVAFPDLQGTDLSHNHLTALPSCLNLTELEWFNLTGNPCLFNELPRDLKIEVQVFSPS